jgi:hypothetical protein
VLCHRDQRFLGGDSNAALQTMQPSPQEQATMLQAAETLSNHT